MSRNYHNAGNHLIEGAHVIRRDEALAADLVDEARHEADDGGACLSANDVVASDTGFVIRTIAIDGTIGDAGADAIVLGCRPLQPPPLTCPSHLQYKY